MNKVFYVPGNASAIDYVRRREDGVDVSYFTGMTLDELQAEYPGAIVGSEDDFLLQMESACITEPEVISAEQYEDALEALPPQDWRGAGSREESFKFMERYAGRVTSIYARVGANHFRFRDIYTLPHSEIIKRVQAVTLDRARAE